MLAIEPVSRQAYQRREERRVNADVISKIMYKCISNYEKGEYSYKETIDMICDALKKVK